MISYEISIGLILMNILISVGSLDLRMIVEFQQNLWLIVPFPPLFILFFISTLAETNRAPFDLPEAEGELVAGFNVEYSSISFALFFMGEYMNIFFMATFSTLLFFGGYSSLDILIPTSIPFPFWFFEEFIDMSVNGRIFGTMYFISDLSYYSTFLEFLYYPLILIFDLLRFRLLYLIIIECFVFISLIPAAYWFAIKICIIVLLFLWVRAAVPRYRYDALMRLTWKVFLPLSFGYLILTASTLLFFEGLPRV